MRPDSLRLIRCPTCGQKPIWEGDANHIEDGVFACGCGRRFPVRDGVANFIHPEQLLPSDQEFKQKYDTGAAKYDEGLAWLFRSFQEDESQVRSAMVDLLRLQPGARVLEIGCGTGRDSEHIARRIGRDGELFALELSSGMLDLAREVLRAQPAKIEYMLANGSYLPFEDRSFDAVFHFGGINEFGEIPRALSEMVRVTKLGGRVVVGDEGVPPWLREQEFGKVLVNANPLYAHTPPLAAIPVAARDVCLRWLLGNAFYVIDFRVAEGPPFVDLDLPIPGKGDSLRSRYEKKRGQS